MKYQKEGLIGVKRMYRIIDRKPLSHFKRMGPKIRVWGFFGRQGSGKSLAMCYLAYEDHRNGADVYSNMRLKFPYTHIKDSSFYKLIPRDGKKKTILLDEIGLGARSSIHQKELERVITLARKLCSENVTLLFSTPQISQYSDLILSFCDKLAEPELWSYKGLPARLRIKFHDKTFRGFKRRGRYSRIFNIEGVHELYDTFQAQNPLTSGSYQRAWDKFGEEYKGQTGRDVLNKLSLRLQSVFGYSNAESRRYARGILSGYNPLDDLSDMGEDTF